MNLLKRIKLAFDIHSLQTWIAAIVADCKRDPSRILEVMALEEKLEYLEFQRWKLRLQAGILEVAK